MIESWHRLRENLRRHLRGRMRPCSPRRILAEAAALVVLHFALVQILARTRLLEHVLSPGPGAGAALAATTFFLLLRVFLFVLGPGWVLTRLWLWASHPGTKRRSRVSARAS